MSSPFQFDQLFKTIDFTQPTLWATVGMVVFNPVFWNFVARNEYHNKTLTKAFGSPYRGTYFLAITIFSLGIFRDLVYERALSHQPTSPALADPTIKGMGAGMFVLGQVLVLSSIWALGITGTYLGDYFGILLSHRITSFPFNLMTDPMYDGSTLCFFGTALWYGKSAGLVVSGVVWVVYRIALRFEGPFTDKIYSSAAAAKKSTSTSSTTTLPSKKQLSSAISTSVSSAKSVASEGIKSVNKKVEEVKAGEKGAAVASGGSGTGSNGKKQAEGSKSSSSKPAVKSESAPTTSTATSGSYASAAAPSTHDSLPSTDPKPLPDLKNIPIAETVSNGKIDIIDRSSTSTPAKNTRAQSVQPNSNNTDAVPGSPMRMTRSRSRARIVDDD